MKKTSPRNLDMTPADFCRVLLRHRGKVAATFGLLMGATVLLTMLLPRTYQSESLLLVRLGRENAALDVTTTLGQAPVVAIPNSRENDTNSIVHLLRSRVIMEKVVDAIGPDVILSGRFDPDAAGRSHPELAVRTVGTAGAVAEPAVAKDSWLDSLNPFSSDNGPDEAVKALKDSLGVRLIEDTNVLRVWYESASPQVAQAVVTQYIETYLDAHVHLNRTAGAHEFLSQQTAHLAAELERAESELRQLKSETGLIDLDAQRQAILARIARLEEDRLATDATVMSTEAEVAELRKALDGLAETSIAAETSGIANQAADGMRGQLYALQLEEQEILSKYTEKHFEVARIRDQITSARAILELEEARRTEITEGPNQLFEEIKSVLTAKVPMLASMRARAEVLRSQLTEARVELTALNENSSLITRLSREVELHDANYRRYSENLEQARIDRSLEQEKITNINVVQPATLEVDPVRPRVAMNLAGGFLLAILAGVGIAFFSEYTTGAFESAKRLPPELARPHQRHHTQTLVAETESMSILT